VIMAPRPGKCQPDPNAITTEEEAARQRAEARVVKEAEEKRAAAAKVVADASRAQFATVSKAMGGDQLVTLGRHHSTLKVDLKTSTLAAVKFSPDLEMVALSSTSLKPFMGTRTLYFEVTSNHYRTASLGMTVNGNTHSLGRTAGNVMDSYGIVPSRGTLLRYDSTTGGKVQKVPLAHALVSKLETKAWNDHTVAIDTVGCGYDMDTKTIFFTLNGARLSDTFTNVSASELWAVIGLSSSGTSARVTFGPQFPVLYTPSPATATDTATVSSSSSSTSTSTVAPSTSG